MLYLLHGNGGGLYDWVNLGHIQPTADALIARGDIPPAIIVMPDAGSTWYVDRKEKMETAVVQDLIADVERSFRAVGARNGRLLAGLSMGGYGCTSTRAMTTITSSSPKRQSSIPCCARTDSRPSCASSTARTYLAGVGEHDRRCHALRFSLRAPPCNRCAGAEAEER